jgi:hypothetical protein
MPATVGILYVCARMAVRATGDEQRVILRHRQLSAGARDGGDDERVGVARVRRRADVRVRLERDDRGKAVEAKRRQITVHAVQHDSERSVATRGDGHRERRIDRQSNASGRERDAWRDVDRRPRQRDAQSPRDSSEAERVAHVEHRFAQPVLEMLEMLRGDAKPIDELRTRIVSHDILGRRTA